MFVTIANRQLNTIAILGAEGLQPGQAGKVKLYVDQRATYFLGGAKNVHYTAATEDTQPAILELVLEEADAFRQQWRALIPDGLKLAQALGDASGGSSMSAGG